jgi:hypothetical protein
LVLVVVVFAAACGGSVAKVTTAIPTSTSAPARVVRSLIEGRHLAAIGTDVDVEGLATDGRGGVWFFAGSAQAGRIYGYDATKGLRSWVIGTAVADRSGSLPPSVAPADAENVYAALNDTLVDLDPVTGALTKIPVPTGVIDPVADAPGPPEIHSSDPIMAIATDGTDQVAIIRRVSSIVQVYDRSQRRFSSVPVPSGYHAIAVGYIGGHVVLGLYNWAAQEPNTLAVYLNGLTAKPVLVGVRDSQRLIPAVDGRVLVGTQIRSILSPNLQVAPIPIPSGLVLDAHLGEHPAGPAAVVGLSVNRNAIVVLDARTGSIGASYPIPMVRNCAMIGPGPGRPGITLPPAPRSCPIAPDAIAADGTQAFALQGSDTAISLIGLPLSQ